MWDWEVSGNAARRSWTTFHLPRLIGSMVASDPKGLRAPLGSQLRPSNGSSGWVAAEFLKIQGPDDLAFLLHEGFSLGFPYWLFAHNTIT